MKIIATLPLLSVLLVGCATERAAPSGKAVLKKSSVDPEFVYDDFNPAVFETAPSVAAAKTPPATQSAANATVDISPLPAPAHKVNAEASEDGGAITPLTAIEAEEVWSVRQGDTVKTTLDAWAAKAGWEASWNAPKDYQLGTSTRFTGSFEKSVIALFDSLPKWVPIKVLTVGKNTPPLVYVTAKEAN